MLAEHRLLDEHRPVRLEFLEQDLGHRAVDTAVEVDADAEVRSHGLTDRRHVGEHRVDLVEAVDELQLLAGVHLDGREAAAGPLPGRGRRLGGPVTADP